MASGDGHFAAEFLLEQRKEHLHFCRLIRLGICMRCLYSHFCFDGVVLGVGLCSEVHASAAPCRAILYVATQDILVRRALWALAASMSFPPVAACLRRGQQPGDLREGICFPLLQRNDLHAV